MTCVEVKAVDMLVRLLRDELRLGWKEDARRRQQGTEPKSCDIVGQFSNSLQSAQEVKETHILVRSVCKLSSMILNHDTTVYQSAAHVVSFLLFIDHLSGHVPLNQNT